MFSQAAEGTGLAFIVFTQAIVELPGAPFWAIIFFLMLLSLGIGSQIGILEGMLCTIFDIDIFKRVRKPILTGSRNSCRGFRYHVSPSASD
jgi:solute carrier family 6 amino acid/orphan transporter-like 15/16/17/18/20